MRQLSLLLVMIIGINHFEISTMNQGRKIFNKIFKRDVPQEQTNYSPLSNIESNALSIPVGTTAEEMQAVFITSPKKLRDIVLHLKDPMYFNQPRYRYEFITGEPGVGKTTVAKAIAFYLT